MLAAYFISLCKILQKPSDRQSYSSCISSSWGVDYRYFYMHTVFTSAVAGVAWCPVDSSFSHTYKRAEEIGFIMLVVAASICCATFNILFLGIILVVGLLALLAMKFGRGLFKGRMNDGMLIITMPSSKYWARRVKLLNLLDKTLPNGRIDSITENHEESIVSYSFVRLKNDTLMELQGNLKKISDEVKSNVFFNRSGEI